MTASRDWVIDIDAAAALRTNDGSLARVLSRPGGREQWEGALADARALAAPAAVWSRVPVGEIDHDAVVLEGGARLAGGPIAEVMAGATEVVLAICTVGQAISDRASEHRRAGLLLRAVLLDELASIAVDDVRQQVCLRISAEASAAGLSVSASLSPGESEWPLADQAVIFGLVDGAAIGVSLAPTLLMRPLKSLTLAIGRGPRPLGREHGREGCDYCVMGDRCAWRGRRKAPAEGRRRAPAPARSRGAEAHAARDAHVSPGHTETG